MNGLISYAEAKNEVCENKKLTVMEQLQLKKSRLQDQLTDVEKTIELFTKNPDLEQCLTMVSRINLNF